jgi:hypothetical protein
MDKVELIYSGLIILAVILAISTLLLIYRLQAQVRSEYYKTFLKQAPCVTGVCPGFEGRDEVLRRLANSETIGQIYTTDSPSIGFSFLNTHINPSRSGHIHFTTNSFGQYEVVEKINLTLGYLTLTTVIDVLGEPDEFLFIAGCGGKGNRVHAKLLYVNRGIEIPIEYATRWPTAQTLAGSTRSGRIRYFSPDNYQEHIIESLNFSIVNNTTAYTLPASVTIDHLLQEIQPWTGFGTTPSVDLCVRHS